MANTGIRVVFCIVNVIYALVAFGLIAGAVWFSSIVTSVTNLRNYEEIQLDYSLYWPLMLPWIFVGVGAFIVLIIACGFGGAIANKKGIMVTYIFFILLAILSSAATGAVTMMIAANKSEIFVKDALASVFSESLNKPHVAEKFNELETYLHCCGVNGYTNYRNRGQQVPSSCCYDKSRCENEYQIRKGCAEVAFNKISRIYLYATSSVGVTAVLGIFSLILAVVIVMKKRSKDVC